MACVPMTIDQLSVPARHAVLSNAGLRLYMFAGGLQCASVCGRHPIQDNYLAVRS